MFPLITQLVGVLCMSSPAPTPDAKRASEPRWPLLMDVASAYYLPTNADRQIHSLFASAMLGTSLVPKRRLTLYGGAMTTLAWGSIVQLEENFEQVSLKTLAGGGGPSFLLRGEPFQRKRISIRLEIGGAALFYRPNFPPGGDFYNLAWQLGASVDFELKPGLRLGLGVRWMHVSNGQGLGPQNPSYEGVGFPISLDWAFPPSKPSQHPKF